MSTRSWILARALNVGLLALASWTLSGCGGGGGGSGDGGAGGDTPNAGALRITSSVTQAEPLQQLALTPSSQAQTSANYKVEVDVSGTGGFAAADTLVLTGLFQDGKILVSAPVLEMGKLSPGATVPTSFAVRVRRGSDGALSDAVTIAYDKLTIPSNRRGASTTMVDMVMKAIMVESGGVLRTTAAKKRPGQLVTAATVLSQQLSSSDIQAEAILRQVFGYTTIDKALPASTSKRAFSLGAGARPLTLSEDINVGFTNLFGCLTSADSSSGQYGQAAADGCFDQAILLVRDTIIPSLPDFQSRFAGIGTIMTGMARGRAGFVGTYIEKLVVGSERNQYVVDAAQIALTAPLAASNPDLAADSAFGTLTELGKRKVFGDLTRNLEGIGKGVSDLLDIEGAFVDNTLSSLTLDNIRKLEDNLSGITIDTQRIKDLAGEFGGDTDTPTSVPFGFGSIPISGPTPTAESICASAPDLDSQLMAAGLGSCVNYLKPFLDPVYSKTTINPLIAEFSTQAALDQVNACAAVTPLTPSCQELFDRIQLSGERLKLALAAYQSKTFDCDGGYAKYINNYGSLTCVFAPLVAPVSGGACVPGSRDADFDVGESRVCVYYSRDYIQANNTCRTNYSLVTFQGYETCRWIGLAPSAPAVYSINTDSGDRATLVP